MGRLGFAVALGLMVSWGSRAGAQITFDVTRQAVALDPTGGLQAFAVADVNKDGVGDILGINDGQDQLEVFLNNGAGKFPAEPSVSIEVGGMLAAVSTGDFDKDGNVDAVLLDTAAASAVFLFGDGTGHFGRRQTVGVVSTPVAVVAADLDNDGTADVAVLSDSTVFLIRSNGDGTFSPFNPASVETRSSGGSSITAGSFDGNNTVDLAVSNHLEAGSVSVLLGNGDGTFKTARLNNVGSGPEGLVAAPLTEDSVQDLAIVDGTEIADLNVSLLYGNGDGTFKSDQRTTAEVISSGIAGADFDLDGKIDLVVSNMSEGFGVAVLRNDPDCSSCSPPTCDCTAGFDLSEVVGFGQAGAIQVGKINGDARPDVVVLSADGQTLGILINSSGNTPTPAPTPTATLRPGIIIDHEDCSIGRPGAASSAVVWWLVAPIALRAVRRRRQKPAR